MSTTRLNLHLATRAWKFIKLDAPGSMGTWSPVLRLASAVGPAHLVPGRPCRPPASLQRLNTAYYWS